MKNISTLIILVFVVSLLTTPAQALELRFKRSKPRDKAEAQRWRQWEQDLNRSIEELRAFKNEGDGNCGWEQDLNRSIEELASQYPLNNQEKDVVLKIALSRKFRQSRGIEEYNFTNEDVEVLQKLVGVEARVEKKDLRTEYLEAAGFDRLVGAEMNSLLVKMYVARAEALFGSADVKHWKPAKNILDAHSKKIFSIQTF